MIKIGYDISILESGRITGVERIALHLFPALWALTPEWEHLAFCRSVPASLRKTSRNVRFIETPGRRFWRYSALPKAIAAEKTDVFISPVMAMPFPCRSLLAPFICECQWRHNSGERGDFLHRLYLWLSALRSDILFPISNYTAEDIHSELGSFLKTPLKVIPLAGSPLVESSDAPLDSQTVLASLGIPFAPYFLFVSTVRAKKNIELMLDAFARDELKDAHLILAGRIDDTSFPESARNRGLKNVHFTGYLPDSSLKALFAHAKAFLYVSKNEGFGLPILEAFNSRLPLIASKMGSIPEVAGDAALYLDELTPKELSDKCLQMLADEKLRKQLVELGSQRAKLYSWERSAILLRDALTGLLSTHGKL